MAAPIKFGVGQSVRRKEDDALIRGRGRYTDDVAPQPALHALVLRSPHAHAKFTINVAKARALPGVAAILTADDVRDLGDLPCLFNLEVDPFTGPPYPILPRDEVRHVGDAMAFVVADTIDKARDAIEAIDVKWTPLPAVAGVAQCGEAGRAAGLAQSCRQRAVRRSGRRQEGDRRGVCQGACGCRSDDGQSARHHQLHGDARGGLRIRRQARSSHADHRQPGQPSPARDHRRHGAEDAAGKDAGDLPRCRRRLRHKAVSLSRVCADRGRGKEAAENHQVDRRSRRSLHRRRAGPRQRHVSADGAGRGRQVSGHGRRPDRRHGRLSVDLRALYPPWRRRHAARPLRHPGLPLPRPHRLHQHRAGRCLSRRRAPGSGVCGRASR